MKQQHLRNSLLSFLIIVMGISTGCSSSAVGYTEQEDDGLKKYIEYNSLQIQSRITIKDIKTRKVGDILQASVDLFNDWDMTLDFQYKFKFYDKDGFEINPDGRPWTPIEMNGNETSSVQATAPNAEATSFKIFVRD